jgi:hypothetical protein
MYITINKNDISNNIGLVHATQQAIGLLYATQQAIGLLHATQQSIGLLHATQQATGLLSKLRIGLYQACCCDTDRSPRFSLLLQHGFCCRQRLGRIPARSHARPPPEK